MNFNTTAIRSIKEISALSGQQNIEADIILPDYYDTIGKIIRCDVTPGVEAVNMAGEKISISGSVKLSLTYMSEEMKIFSYENEYKYTKVFQAKAPENCVCTDICQNIFSVNCRAIGPKRIEFRSILQISGKIKMIKETDVISETNETEVITKTENIAFSEPVIIATKDFTVSKTDIITEADSKKHIIRKNNKMLISEMKPIHNKLYIKGYFETQIFYFNENSTEIRRDEINIPFSEILDLFGLEEDDICKITAKEIFSDIIHSEASGKKTSEIRINALLDIKAFRNTTKQIVTDAYSVKSYLTPETVNTDVVINEYTLSNKESISFEADIFDDSTITVCDAFIDNIKITCDQKQNKLTSLITADFNALLKDNNGSLYMISREHTFETLFSLPDSSHRPLNTQVNMLSISALQSKSDKITFRCEMDISVEIEECRKVKAITNFNLTPCSLDDSKEKFILYFACKGEELWTIAKENMTSVDTIKALNNITSEKISENMTILLPSF